jgi:OmpA-OmpF porin, OOP family
MKKISLVLLTSVFALSTFAQSTSLKKRPTLGVSFTLKDFATPVLVNSLSLSKVFSDNVWSPVSSMSPGLSISYFEGLTDKVDFMGGLHGFFTNYPFVANAAAASSNQDKFLLEADASVNFKLLTDKHVVVPFLTAGVGASMFAGSYFAAYVPVGYGLQINLGDENFINLMFRSNIRVTNLATNNYNYSLGFTSPLKDKVETKLAPVPVAPVKEVVKLAEEKDTDGDGIVDSKDKCPTVKGLAKYEGCPIPDSDKDGINDEEDKCPSVSGTTKYGGCPIPDTDKDGVNDEEDKCPSVSGLARYGGCPIPDSDNDGINDEEDKCPTTAGSKTNNGCPDLKEQYNFQAKNIQFATGKSDFLPSAIAEMNKLAEIMKQHPELKKVNIEGHTDNTGKADKNLALSQKRCDAVKAYLVKKGISADRLSAVGYGDTKPSADNATPAGRTANRRVDFKVGE